MIFRSSPSAPYSFTNSASFFTMYSSVRSAFRLCCFSTKYSSLCQGSFESLCSVKGSSLELVASYMTAAAPIVEIIDTGPGRYLSTRSLNLELLLESTPALPSCKVETLRNRRGVKKDRDGIRVGVFHPERLFDLANLFHVFILLWMRGGQVFETFFPSIDDVSVSLHCSRLPILPV